MIYNDGYLPDGLPREAICQMEGHDYRNGVCRNCGEVNRYLMGYSGSVARWAKAWKVSEDEAERRIEEHRSGKIETGGQEC